MTDALKRHQTDIAKISAQRFGGLKINGAIFCSPDKERRVVANLRQCLFQFREICRPTSYYARSMTEAVILDYGHAARIVKSWTADLAELEKALPKIRDYPTLLMWGKEDRAVHFQSAERLRQNFRDVRLVAFDGVGHLPYEEAPDEFNRALIEFLGSGQQ